MIVQDFLVERNSLTFSIGFLIINEDPLYRSSYLTFERIAFNKATSFIARRPIDNLATLKLIFLFD
jgi:hypothetical protein